MSLLISMSSRAEFISVMEMIKTKDCQIELLRPVVIMKREMTGSAHLLDFRANFMDRKSNRSFSRGTVVEIRKANRSTIFFKDIELNSLCVMEGNLCADLDRMTKLDLEYHSNNSIKFTCKNKRNRRF